MEIKEILPRETIIRKIVEDLLTTFFTSASIEFHIERAILHSGVINPYREGMSLEEGDKELRQLLREVREALLTRIQYRA